MEITKEVVKKVAEVARLRLTGNEVDRFTPQLKEILEAFSLIDEVDTQDTKMSIQPVEIKNALREDKVGECLSVEDALRNTEHKKDNYFKGPKAI
jgi:aspartyl-tRNA(Asn)/glutamyl-tRNA(Gln) amidotransferase subunit C